MSRRSRLPGACWLACTISVLVVGGSGCRSRCSLESTCCVGGVLVGPPKVCSQSTELACLDTCGGAISRQDTTQYCSGLSAACDGPIERTPWKVEETCTGQRTCVMAWVPEQGRVAKCACDAGCGQPNQTCWNDAFACSYQGCALSCCAAGEGCGASGCSTIATVGLAYSVAFAVTSAVALYDGSSVTAGYGPDGDLLERHGAAGELLWTKPWPSAARTSTRAAGSRNGQAIGVWTTAGGCSTVAAVDLDGNPSWTRPVCVTPAAGTASLEAVLAVADDGAIAVAASATGSWQIDRGDGTQAVLTTTDPLVVLLLWDAGGTLRSASTVASSPVGAAVLEPAAGGGWYLVGRYSGQTVFGAGSANETTLGASGLYVARYDGPGALVWVRTAVQSPFMPALIGFAAGDDGGSVIAAHLAGAGAAGGGPSTIPLPAGDALAALDPDGLPVWAHLAGAPAAMSGASLVGVAYAGGFAGVFAGTVQAREWATVMTQYGSPPAVFVSPLDAAGAWPSAQLVALAPVYGLPLATCGTRILAAFGYTPTIPLGHPAASTYLSPGDAAVVGIDMTR